MFSTASLKYKIAIIFLIPALGMLFFSSKYVNNKYNVLLQVEKLSGTIAFIQDSSKLIHELQKERGLSSGYLGDDYLKFHDALKKQRLSTDKTRSKFLSSLSNNVLERDKAFTSRIKKSLSQLEKLSVCRKRVNDRNVTFYKEIQYFSHTVQTLIASIPHVNDNYSSIEISNSMESLLNLISMKEYAGIERAFLSNVFSQRVVSPEQLNDIRKLIIKQKIHHDSFARYSSINNFISFQRSLPHSLNSDLKTYRELILNSPTNNDFNVQAMEWFDFSTNRINKIDSIIQNIMQDVLTKGEFLKKESNNALIVSGLFWVLSLIALIILSLILRYLISHQEKNLSDLNKQKKYYATLSDMSENFIYLKSGDELYNSLCRVLVQISEFHGAWIGRVDEKSDGIVPHASNNLSLKKLSLMEFSVKPDQKNLLALPVKAFLQRKNVILSNSEINQCDVGRKTLGEDVKSAASFPIFHNNKIISILSIYSKEDDVFSLELVNLIEKILKGLSFALNKIQEHKLQLQTKEDLRIASYAFDAQEAMAITDLNANILKVNQAFSEITGYKVDEVIGKNPRVLQSSKHTKEFYQEMWSALKNSGKWKGEIYNQRKNGDVYPEILSITAIKNDENETTHYIAQFLDISHIKQAQLEAEHKAHHDVLTGIANRAKLINETEMAFTRAKRSNIQHAFMFLDIDKFKQINDFYGHKVGDELLVEVASRLESSVRKGDVVARLGGDEFAIVALDLDSNEHAAAKKATILAEKIQAKVAQPIVIDSQIFDITFSIGVKLFPDYEKTAQEVISHADIAMYQAKKSGRNQFAFFDHELNIESKRFLMIEQELKVALKSKQLELYYQPTVNLLTDSIVGAEALIRWNHPTKGILFPDSFMDVANDTKLIYKIGEFVIEEACKQLSLWNNDLGFSSYSISINISSYQFKEKSFVEYLKNAISKYDVNPQNLELELLENTLIEDMEDTIEKIKSLKELGVKFSIDDFGTGYSSMTYLKELPVDSIKIDKSFIVDLNNKSNQEIVKMIINFANLFNLKVIAEGVETKYALDFLKDNGCNHYQGFYFSRAIQSDKILKLLT